MSSETTRPPATLRTRLARLGFTDPGRSAELWLDADLRELLDGHDAEPLLEALAPVA